MQKRKRRGKMIKHLQDVNDPFIKKFKKEELQPVIDNNNFHSPEDSKTDDGKIQIVVKDIQWRSSAVIILFFLFIFSLFYWLILTICNFQSYVYFYGISTD